MIQLTLLFLVVGTAVISGSSICPSPQIKSEVYTTSDAQLSSDTVVVVEFELKCSNGAKDVNLHAEFSGRTFPVTVLPSPNKYQISVTDEHKKLPKGSYQVRLFDDESYSELRKAQRSGTEDASVAALATIDIAHKGTSRGPWVQTEHIATAAAILVCNLAHTVRRQL